MRKKEEKKSNEEKRREKKEVKREVLMQEVNIYERNHVNCMSSIISEVLSDET